MLMQKRPLRAVAGALGTLACVVVMLIYQHAPMSSYRKIIDTPSNSEAYPQASATSSTGDKSVDKPLEESWVRPASLANAWPEDLATNWHASAEQLLELDGIIDRAARCADPPCYGSDDATDWAGRRDQVVEAARTVWGAYKRHGFGRDEYFPISGESGNFTRWGIGYFIADVLDTLLLMGLNDEYQEGRDFLVSQVTFDQNGAVSLFETTIRLLGGLLSAFHWTGETDTPLLELADALGGRLAKSFNTSSGIPPETAMLRSDGQPQAMDSTTAEVTTLQMEFR
ncbi:Endoplasmic reticulum mannosyl-oligosaccharide 1,2-alpha-mannosidase, partial [Coemansia sp. RSA 552]